MAPPTLTGSHNFIIATLQSITLPVSTLGDIGSPQWEPLAYNGGFTWTHHAPQPTGLVTGAGIDDG